MRTNSTAAIFGALTGLGILAGSVLTALGHAVPEFIPYLSTAAISALAGVSIPVPSLRAAEDTISAATAAPVAPAPITLPASVPLVP